MIYLLCTVLSGAVLAAVCVPLFRKEQTLENVILEETQWDLLQRKKEVLLGNLQDLDFEFKCGKLSDADYQKVRSEMTRETADVLAEIDRIETSQDLDALIRREVAQRKGRKIENVLCPDCHKPNPKNNKFCADCGAKLKPA